MWEIRFQLLSSGFAFRTREANIIMGWPTALVDQSLVFDDLLHQAFGSDTHTETRVTGRGLCWVPQSCAKSFRREGAGTAVQDETLNRCIEVIVGAADTQGLEGTQCPQNSQQPSIMVLKSLGSKPGKVRQGQVMKLRNWPCKWSPVFSYFH